MKSIIPLLFYTFLRVPAADAAASFLPSSFTAWTWLSTIVVDKWLYIDGGEIRSLDEGVTNISPNYQTFSIDLSKSWTTSSVTASAFTRNTSSIPARRPQLYYDKHHNTVYSSGGLFYGKDFAAGDVFTLDNKPAVWGFTPDTDGSVEWTEKFSKDLDSSFPLVSNTWDALTASTSGKHYAIGGSIYFFENATLGLTGEMAMEQFVTYDYATRKFTNQTLPLHTVGGEAHFVPQYGKEGVILFFGGTEPLDKSVSDTSINQLATIHVYDIHTGKFYNQTAENPPIGRTEFCSVGVSNEQNNSHEIFIFGGSIGESSTTVTSELNKVYILTLPSFTWIEAPNPASGNFRAGHSCALIGPQSIPSRNQRQMLVVGGDGTPRQSDAYSYVDPWTSAMKTFDLSALTWGDSYDATAKAYVRPDIVNKFYTTNPPFPAKWGDIALLSIFNTNGPAAVAPAPIPTPSPPPTNGDLKPNVGAIAGGVVGGVCALVIVGLLIFCCRRRRLASKSNKDVRMQDYEGFDQQPRYQSESYQALPKELPAQVVSRELPSTEAPNGIYANVAHELPAEPSRRHGHP